MAGLFGNNRDEDLYKSRALQESSTIVNDNINRDTSASVYTVTAGKTLYLTDVSFINADGGEIVVSIRDGVGAGTNLVGGVLGDWIGAEFVVSFSTPLEVKSDIYLFTAGDVFFNFNGWEE